MKGYCKNAKQHRRNQLMQCFPGQFELPQQQLWCYAVMCVLLLASVIVHVETATAADRVNHAVIAVHVPSSTHTCKRLKVWWMSVWGCVIPVSCILQINLEMKGYCKNAKQCRRSWFELPQPKHLCYDLCATTCLCNCTWVIHAVIVVHVPSSAHTCKRLKLALKELQQQLMNQALVNQRKEPQNQNSSKLIVNEHVMMCQIFRFYVVFVLQFHCELLHCPVYPICETFPCCVFSYFPV